MRFAQPQMFWLLLGILVLAVFYILAFRRKHKMLERFGNIALIEKMTKTTSAGRQYLKAFLIISAYFFIVLALARPQWGMELDLVSRKGVDIIVAIDVSKSMMAEDIKPNRLRRAKYELGHLIDKLKGDRIGIVAFSGDAFLQCPLTMDYGAAKMFLDFVEVGTIPVGGTSLAKAIKVARTALFSKSKKYKVIVLITDGEDYGGQVMQEVNNATDEGVVIYTLGIGSESGVPIPLRNERGEITYKKDKDGNVVMTKLNPYILEKISAATKGKFYQSKTGSLELDRIYKSIRKMEKRKFKSKQFSRFKDRYQWPLSIALLLVIVEFFINDRRRKKIRWDGRFL